MPACACATAADPAECHPGPPLLLFQPEWGCQISTHVGLSGPASPLENFATASSGANRSNRHMQAGGAIEREELKGDGLNKCST